MKRLFALLLFSLALPLAAQGIDVPAERARITAQRKQADARFAQEEKDCRAKFAVTDCVSGARTRQREALADLRRQEITLNDMERKRRADEKARELQERQSPERLAEQARQRAQAVDEQKVREARLAERTARKAKEQAEAQAGSKPEPRKPKAKTPAVSASKSQANRRAVEKRQAEAAEHRVKAAKRESQRQKAPAASLPVPP